MPADAMATDDLLALLPGELARIGEIVGVEAALRLADGWGGTRLYVPLQVEPDHPIAQAIGLEAARRLSAEYALERLEIPKADGWRRAMRNALIARSDGSQCELARAHGFTQRWIREIQRRAEEEDPTGELF